jgi:hypothetical protein
MGQQDRIPVTGESDSCPVASRPFWMLRRSAVTDTTSPPQHIIAASDRGVRVRQWLIEERVKNLLTKDRINIIKTHLMRKQRTVTVSYSARITSV